MRTWIPPLLLAACALAALPAATSAELVDGSWRYTFEAPPAEWSAADFDDRDWRDGAGGFGAPGTPNARIGTRWTTSDVWLRRSFTLDKPPANPALLLHHDEDVEVYLNGVRAVALKGYLTDYQVVPLTGAGRDALRAGKNVLAVHCRQERGGQFVDVHVVDADDVPALPEPQRGTEPFKSPLITPWGADVTPENAWQEYPRPDLVREGWTNLNGQWDYAVVPAAAATAPPAEFAGKILVPFCIESRLSGVQRLLNPGEVLWYRRSIELQPQVDRRQWLNFEAVDYACEVFLNGQKVGSHVGGNAPFSVELTAAARPGVNELTVRVEDATRGTQLRGKQTLDPEGIWYTRVSGIWQTVWLEETGPRPLVDLHVATDAAAGTIALRPETAPGAAKIGSVRAVAFDGDREVARAEGAAEQLLLTVPDAKLWSPDAPHLYDLEVTVLDQAGQIIDQVRSYAGIRTVGVEREDDGHLRFTLNGKPLFHWGPLDQGWWPDGLLTPPSDAAMKSDIEFLKSAGFNMIRKHIKVEPRRYYYHCDRLGMLMWQDHVSALKNPPWTTLRENPTDAQWTDAEHAQFMQEFAEMVDALDHFPCIVVWVPFNEAWGQHRTMEVGQWILQRDPSRSVNIASGGNFWPVGHVVDAHHYPHPQFPFQPERFRDYVHVMGEFGGHGWPTPGHLWDDSPRNWGYGGLPQSLEEYEARYRQSISMLKDLKARGIAGGVYTQTTDVEGEINGLLTYDRKVQKLAPEKLREIHRGLVD